MSVFLIAAAVACGPGADEVNGGNGNGIGNGDDNGEERPLLGTDILVYEGDGALPSDSGRYLIDGIDDLVAIYEALSAEVHVSATLPADMTPYRLVFWHMPGSADSSNGVVAETTVAALEEWIGWGGRLVMSGDYGGSYGGYDLRRGNETVGVIAELLGVAIRITQSLEGSRDCDADGSHPLMAGGATVSWYASSSLTVAHPAVWLYCNGLAVQALSCGEVVVIGDVNPVTDRPSLAPQFVENLYTVPVSAGACE